MHYNSNVNLAFLSIEHIMRDVNYGWLMRYSHSNGASMFFIAIFIHFFRGLYYGSYIEPRELLWIVGVIILLLMIVTAFIGYVLPWGQMSFWGATVITNLFSAIPKIGSNIVKWLWGGFAIGSATLTRFFAFHFTLPYILTLFVGIHVFFLHKVGSNNPLGISSSFTDKVLFGYYYLSKDTYGIIIFLIFFAIFIFFYPNTLGHPDNYIRANPLSTPSHIVPEWYFLVFYAILRSIPNKLGGVLGLFLAIMVLFFLPFLNTSERRSFLFKPISKYIFWFIVIDCFFLAFVGSKPVKVPFLDIGILSTLYYYTYFILVLPFLGYFEDNFWKFKYLNKYEKNKALANALY